MEYAVGFLTHIMMQGSPKAGLVYVIGGVRVSVL